MANTIRFLTVGDTHVAPDGGCYATPTNVLPCNSITQLTNVVNFSNSIPSEYLDFTVLLGDQSDNSDADYQAVKNIISGFTKQYYLLCGNHDIGTWGNITGSVYHNDDKFIQWFGPAQYIVNYKGYQFLFVSTGGYDFDINGDGTIEYGNYGWKFDFTNPLINWNAPTIVFIHGGVDGGEIEDWICKNGTCYEFWNNFRCNSGICTQLIPNKATATLASNIGTSNTIIYYSGDSPANPFRIGDNIHISQSDNITNSELVKVISIDTINKILTVTRSNNPLSHNAGETLVLLNWFGQCQTSGASGGCEAESGIQLDNFEILSNWILSGTGSSYSLDTLNFREGSASIKVNATNGVRASIDKVISLSNLNNANSFSVWMYVYDNTTLNNITMYITSTGAPYSKYFSFWTNSMLNEKQKFVNGWNEVIFEKDYFTNNNGESWNNTMNRIKLAVIPKAGMNTSVSFDDLRQDTCYSALFRCMNSCGGNISVIRRHGTGYPKVFTMGTDGKVYPSDVRYYLQNFTNLKGIYNGHEHYQNFTTLNIGNNLVSTFSQWNLSGSVNLVYSEIIVDDLGTTSYRYALVDYTKPFVYPFCSPIIPNLIVT